MLLSLATGCPLVHQDKHTSSTSGEKRPGLTWVYQYSGTPKSQLVSHVATLVSSVLLPWSIADEEIRNHVYGQRDDEHWGQRPLS